MTCPPLLRRTSALAYPGLCPHDSGGEELRFQSQEDQELSAAAAACQLILKMSSEDQTVDPRNKLMGNDHGTIFV
jgi:hypothetical protein